LTWGEIRQAIQSDIAPGGPKGRDRNPFVCFRDKGFFGLMYSDSQLALPEHLGRRALLIQQADEVPVLGHHHRLSRPCLPEDLRITGIPQANLPHRHGSNSPWLLPDPAGQGWRQLGIQPQRHPISTGWSISRAA
jgi:hypothetical protein